MNVELGTLNDVCWVDGSWTEVLGRVNPVLMEDDGRFCEVGGKLTDVLGRDNLVSTDVDWKLGEADETPTERD